MSSNSQKPTPILEIENLGKRYSINKHKTTERVSWLKSIFTFGALTQKKKEIWALRNATFKIDKGDMVAVLGDNGSGKSTLLKLLSEITDPTEGSIVLRGSISSILEVGIGFHHELTGRENIYLNGALLGMNKKEIDERFREIIDFSEIEEYLDVPIKRYSSGMFVRLAFAVASHLRTEILLIDEVLAVGDSSFRSKAIKRMKDLHRRGCTIIIVSHDLDLLESLCFNAIWINNGQLIETGDVKSVVASYRKTKETIPLSKEVV